MSVATKPAPVAGESILSVRNISKSFGAIKAVQNVSFDVHDGEVLGLIGPNGSGKSTLFNCILGQYTADTGEVLFNGESVGGQPAHSLNKRGIGRTFQQLSVFPDMSVLDNIIMAGQEHHGTMWSRLLGPPDVGLTDEAEQLISFFRLEHLRHEKAGSLSYGQQKLVDAAMAFMAGPGLVLLDEPAGGVNLTMLEYLKDRLRTYNREHGTTFVVIEHNMEFVMSLCTRIIVLAEGSVIAEGTPDEIRANQRVIDAYLGG
jgi:branched-chain amino acid transport system ATP-binding protein